MTTHLHVPPLSKECTCVLNSPIASRAFQGHSETNKQLNRLRIQQKDQLVLYDGNRGQGSN